MEEEKKLEIIFVNMVACLYHFCISFFKTKNQMKGADFFKMLLKGSLPFFLFKKLEKENKQIN